MKSASKKALILKPDFAEALGNNLGNVFQDQGKLDEAIDVYKNSISLKPDYAEPFYNLGVAFLYQDKMDEVFP